MSGAIFINVSKVFDTINHELHVTIASLQFP